MLSKNFYVYGTLIILYTMTRAGAVTTNDNNNNRDSLGTSRVHRCSERPRKLGTNA